MRKTTKYRNKMVTRKAHGRSAKRRVDLVLYAFLGVCVGVFVSIGVSNAILSDVKGNQNTWIVQDAQMEILAPVQAGTLDLAAEQTEAEAQSGLPFLQSTPTIEPQATLVTLPTPAPTAQPDPEVPGLSPEEELESVSITITAVGDCTLGGEVKNGYYRYFQEYAAKYGADYFLENVRELFESDDLTIVNLEGPLTTSDDMRSGRTFNFRGDPKYVQILSGSSVEIANVANNHALDFGKSGLQETAQVLTDAGVGVSGFGLTYTTEVKGVKVCSLGFTEWDYTEAEIVRAISEARSECDLLIVSVHWGEEKAYSPTNAQVQLGRKMVDAGADIVIGNHSHVYGGVEKYQGKYIIYSLGNFCFGGNTNPSDKNCTIFQQTFNVSKDGAVSDGGINIIPARVSGSDSKNDYQPYILTGEAAAKQLSKIAKVSNVDSDELLWMEYQPGAVGAVALQSAASD